MLILKVLQNLAEASLRQKVLTVVHVLNMNHIVRLWLDVWAYKLHWKAEVYITEEAMK